MGAIREEIKYPFNALKTFLKSSGHTPEELFSGLDNGGGSPLAPTNLDLGVTLIWAGLLHQGNSLTVEQVGDWLDERDGRYMEMWQAAVEALMASMQRSFGLASEEDPEPGKKK